MQFYKNTFGRNPRHFEWPRGIARPSLYQILALTGVKGIDISHWQTIPDFAAVKASGHEFAIIKATEGTNWVDPKFNDFWRRAADAGIIVGAYHFFRSNYRGDDQADHFLSTIYPMRTAQEDQVLPGWLDSETKDGISVDKRSARAVQWGNMVRTEFKKPGFYCSPYLWAVLYGNENLGSGWHGWAAHWTSGDPIWPVGWTEAQIKIWQKGVYPKHSWTEPVPGITSAVDKNLFLGTLAELKAFANIGEEPPPPPPPDDVLKLIIALTARVQVLEDKGLATDELLQGLVGDLSSVTNRVDFLEQMIQAVEAVLSSLNN